MDERRRTSRTSTLTKKKKDREGEDTHSTPIQQSAIEVKTTKNRILGRPSLSRPNDTILSRRDNETRLSPEYLLREGKGFAFSSSKLILASHTNDDIWESLSRFG